MEGHTDRNEICPSELKILMEVKKFNSLPISFESVYVPITFLMFARLSIKGRITLFVQVSANQKSDGKSKKCYSYSHQNRR